MHISSGGDSKLHVGANRNACLWLLFGPCNKLATCSGCNPNTAGTGSSAAAALSAGCRVKGKRAAKVTTSVRADFKGGGKAVNPASGEIVLK